MYLDKWIIQTHYKHEFLGLKPNAFILYEINIFFFNQVPMSTEKIFKVDICVCFVVVVFSPFLSSSF